MRKIFALSDKGVSIIEVLISFALVTIVSMATIQVTLNQKKAQKQAELLALKKELAGDLQNSLAMSTQCSTLIKAASAPLGATIADSLVGNPDLSGNLNKKPFVDDIDHPQLTIDTVTLNYAKDTNDDAQKSSDYTVYRGSLTFRIVGKTEYLRQAYIEMRPVVISVVLFNALSSKKWADVSCVTPESQSASTVSEGCALYGGSLIDATHCDFTRVFQKHQNVTESAVPVANVNSAQTSRVTLSDVMCYLDTLTTMIPDPDFSKPGIRNYAKDSYSQSYYTRFCKRPGMVQAGKVVDMNKVKKYISVDVRKYFPK